MKNQKNLFKSKKLQLGVSLLDVLVAVTVVVLGISSLVTLNTFISKNQRRSSDRTEAVKISQETMEWVRVMRQRFGWDSFYNTLSLDAVGGSGTYCIAEITHTLGEFTNLGNRECVFGEDEILDRVFVREVEYALGPGVETIQVTSRVRWLDGNDELQTETTTILRKWNE